MKQIRQAMKLKLEDRHLRVSRLTKQAGQLGKRESWKIKTLSNLPRSLYFMIHSFVRRRVENCEDDSFHGIKKAVLRALCEAAYACGCNPQFGKEGGDVCWFLQGRPFFAFQIHYGEIDKVKVARMREGEAMFRWAITVMDGGFVQYHPRRTRFGYERAKE